MWLVYKFDSVDIRRCPLFFKKERISVLDKDMLVVYGTLDNVG